MEEKKQSNGGVIAIVILSILLILTSGYIVYEKMNGINQEKKNNNINNNSVIDNRKPTEVKVSEETAKKLVDVELKNFLNYEKYTGLDKGISFNNVVSALDWILSQNVSKELKTIGNFCGSELEKVLVSKKIIVGKGEGQFACDSTDVYKLSDIKAKAKEYFKDSDKLDFTTLATSEAQTSSYYYEPTTASIVVRVSGVQSATIQYLKHSVESNILNISFTSNDGAINSVDVTYIAKFDIVNNKYYINSITKASN